MNPTRRATVWWREPMMWIVVGGPLAVVCASALTAVIAWNGADQVLPEAADRGRAVALQPAIAARNRGATSR